MRNRLHDEHANSMAEPALLLPFLFILVLGTLEIGQGFRTYMALGNAARKGARWLTTHPTDPSDVRTMVASQAALAGLSAGRSRPQIRAWQVPARSHARGSVGTAPDYGVRNVRITQ